MEAVIITLLILLVFLLIYDSRLLQNIKNKMSSRTVPPTTIFPENEPVVYEDNSAAVVGTSGFMNSREATTSWEPSTADFTNLGNDKIYKAYAEDLKANVDRAIVESHREYTSDSDFLATTGASHASARDDFNPPIPFHGLPRRAHYAHVGADRTARIGQSETPEAIAEIKNHNSTGYAL